MLSTKENKNSDIKINANDNSIPIEVKNLKKHFVGKRKREGIKAVDGVTFHVEHGEFFGLLGPNGAGKTTIINILTGSVSPTEGTAVVGGYNVKTDLKKIKEIISVCPQDPSVYKFLTGIENIQFFGNLHLMSKKEIMERAEELLKLL